MECTRKIMPSLDLDAVFSIMHILHMLFDGSDDLQYRKEGAGVTQPLCIDLPFREKLLDPINTL